MFNDNNVSIFNGKKLNIKVYGASHADKIGVEVNGLTKGEVFDKTILQDFCDRRKPKTAKYSTTRKEQDIVNYLSGVLDDGTFDGNTFSAVIYNTDQKSNDYVNVVKTPRPSHADFPAWVKYGDNFDYRGGGKFSGRMTAPICIIGGICKQLLQKKGISINAYISSIGKVKGVSYKDTDPLLPDLSNIDYNFPLADNSYKPAFEDEISSAVKTGDSVVVITGKDAGKKGKVLSVDVKKGRITVEGVNIVSKHQKARKAQEKSQIVKKEGTIDISNVMILCPTCGKPTRVKHTEVEGKSVRVCKCGTTLERAGIYGFYTL